jgi:hypothetical protein
MNRNPTTKPINQEEGQTMSFAPLARQSSEEFVNAIPATQNQEDQLKLLAAQRALYWKAKRWVAFQIILTIVVIIALVVIGDQAAWWRPWGAIAGMLILFGDTLFFESIQKRLRRRAAKIQEVFDCKVLKLDWNEFFVGSCPDEEEVIEYETKYRDVDPEYSKLHDWYSAEVGGIPLHIARIICQRSNIRWDFKLRQRFGGIVLAFTITVVTALLAWGLVTHSSLEDTILVLASLSPLLVWGGREFQKQRESAENLTRLRENVKEVWDEIVKNKLTAEECKDKSRALQDALFDHRKNSPVVFDWIYRLLQPKSEKEMNITAQTMIDELSQRPLEKKQDDISKTDSTEKDSKGVGHKGSQQ